MKEYKKNEVVAYYLMVEGAGACSYYVTFHVFCALSFVMWLK